MFYSYLVPFSQAALGSTVAHLVSPVGLVGGVEVGGQISGRSRDGRESL